MASLDDELITAYCPRCDKAYVGKTEDIVNTMIERHLERQIDDLHNGALEEWKDDSNDTS